MALVFVITSVIVILYQLLLALGLPWGEASMGGKFPSKYPTNMRLVALINAIILGCFVVIVLSKTRIAFDSWISFSNFAIWAVVLVIGISTILNIISPSKIEKIWVPVSLLQFISALMIALK